MNGRTRYQLLNFLAHAILVGAVLGTLTYLTLELQRDPYRALGECQRLAEMHDIDMVACLDVVGRGR